MPTVTALAPAPREYIHVELEGARWRTLHADVVAAAHLRVGEDLDRRRLRELRHAIRRVEALHGAVSALRRRDFTRADLDARLERQGVAADQREAAISTLSSVGYVDDARVAARRAVQLADRDWGNAAIDADLERSGITPDLRAEAIAALEPEHARAARILTRRGATPKTLGFLGRKGFGEDALEAAADAVHRLEG